ncbi:MAG TPA: hypothetical protein VGL82_21705 [Bryobacteraceae bacterium]
MGLLIDLIGNYEHRTYEPFPAGGLGVNFRTRTSEVLSGVRGIGKA